MRRTFAADRFHVLDTTHPKAIRALESKIDPERTLFLSASKSGTTLETRSHTAYFLERGGQFAAITDPGLRPRAVRARERLPRASSTASRRSAGATRRCRRSGSCPAVLMGIDATRLLERAIEMQEACRYADGNPGLELGLRLGSVASVGLDVDPDSFGLWMEQLVAESTGKQGKGILPGARRPERRAARGGALPEPVRARAGVLPLGVRRRRRRLDHRHQSVRPARRAGGEGQDERGARAAATSSSSRRDRSTSCSRRRATATTSASRRSSTRRAWTSCSRSSTGARESGHIVTHGFGPRYLHSTGQFHKGGPNTGLFLQVVDDTGDELPIPGRDFGFARLIRAQAAGDYESLKERGRRVAR